MNFFGIGLPEMAVIAAIGLLVFGPKRLPELGRTLGRTLKGFQSASREFEQEFRKAVDTETVSATSLPAAGEPARSTEASSPALSAAETSPAETSATDASTALERSALDPEPPGASPAA
jgi:sec-independent protein translocase protein TatA